MIVDMNKSGNDNIVHTLTFNPNLQELIDNMIPIRKIPYNCTCDDCEAKRCKDVPDL